MEGKKLITIKEIAKILNVSPSTVSRALKGHPSISGITTERVRKIAKENNFVLNKSAIFFNQKRSYTLGLIVPDLSEPFFSTALSAIEKIASAQNYNIMIGQSHDNVETEMTILQKFIDHRVDGIIVSISKQHVFYQQYIDLEKLNIPVVFFDCIPEDKYLHYVASNLHTGLLKGINALIEQCHYKIALINGPVNLAATRQRLIGYVKGLNEHHITVRSDLITTTDLSTAGNIAAINSLIELNDPPTAIIVFNDNVLLDCFSVIKLKGLVDKFKFISFANQPDWKYYDHKPFGSIEQFPAEQGKIAAELLMKLINGDVHKGQIGHKYYQFHVDSEIVYLND